VGVREHAEGFYETYRDAEVYGPFLDGDRYAVERPREFTTPEAFAESDALFDVALGPHVESSLADGYDVLAGTEVADLAGEFGRELAAYFDPVP
jgi:tRNA nucleotidyltransferase (CCA-adding enzyme)